MAKFARPGKEPAPVPPSEQLLASVDEEVREWKRTRGSRFPIQLLTVVAAISFDIAAIALPDAVSDWLQYPLYALSAASLYVGFFRRRKDAART